MSCLRTEISIRNAPLTPHMKQEYYAIHRNVRVTEVNEGLALINVLQDILLVIS